MALTGKFTTIYDVMERVNRSGFTDFTLEEAKEWTWEVIQLIGADKHLIDKVAVLSIADARASLPYDISDITEGGVRDYYTKVTLTKESDIYYDPNNVGEGTNVLHYQTDGESVVYIDGIKQTEDLDTYLTLLPEYHNYPLEKATYKINYGFIYTGFKTGVVEVAYKAFPTDNEDNPMIEDSIEVIRATVAYIKKMVAERMWLRDEISDSKKRALGQDYSWAVGAAISSASIGSVDDIEAIRARTQRLYRDPNLQRVGFSDYGRGEHLNLD